MKNSKEKEQKKSKRVVLMIIIPLLIVAIIIGGIFFKKYYDLKKPIEEVWGQTYYVYLRDVHNNGKAKEAELPSDMKNAKINFYDVKDVSDPIMAISYQKDEKNYTNVYYIKDEKVNTLNYKEETIIEFLYNIEKKEYDYYSHTSQGKKDIYTSLGTQINELINGNANTKPSNDEGVIDEATSEYVFEEGEKSTVTDVNGDEISIPKFDETFVEVETDDNGIDYDLELNEEELKEAVTSGVDEYETSEEVVTEKIEEVVKKKVEEVDKKHEEMKKAEEAVKKKKEEEEKARKEAEAKELALGYKIGSYRLKYGTYKNLPMDDINITITLSPNGKCHYKGNDPNSGSKNIDTDCTYSQTKSEYYGVMTYFLTMKFNSGGSTAWQMSKSNAFNSQWLGFEYVG